MTLLTIGLPAVVLAVFLALPMWRVFLAVWGLVVAAFSAVCFFLISSRSPNHEVDHIQYGLENTLMIGFAGVLILALVMKAGPRLFSYLGVTTAAFWTGLFVILAAGALQLYNGIFDYL